MAIEPITIRPARAIGEFTVNVILEELHRDELQITEHPVEQGAAISDHAYKRPASVEIRPGWSNADAAANGDPLYVQTLYANFLALQAARSLFSITTGKRTYVNMLVQSLAETTNKDTEGEFRPIIICREIILVSTTTTLLAPDELHAFSQSTGSVQDRGTVSPVPANSVNQDAVPPT